MRRTATGINGIKHPFNFQDTPKEAVMHPCEVCGVPDKEKPMCFKGERWCSENHRKQIMGEK